jgi:uncharacterized protein (DUF4415 family)
MADPHKAPRAPGYVQNPHYTQEDWDEVSDAPELTDEELAQAKPFAEAFPELAKSIARRGPQKAPNKVAISIRLAPDVLAALKATGPGWQSRVSELLRKALRANAPERLTARRAPVAKRAAKKKSA